MPAPADQGPSAVKPPVRHQPTDSSSVFLDQGRRPSQRSGGPSAGALSSFTTKRTASGGWPWLAAARWLCAAFQRKALRTTSFRPDHTMLTAQTLMSPQPSGRASSRAMSSVMSVATLDAFLGQHTHSAAAGRRAWRPAASGQRPRPAAACCAGCRTAARHRCGRPALSRTPPRRATAPAIASARPVHCAAPPARRPQCPACGPAACRNSRRLPGPVQCRPSKAACSVAMSSLTMVIMAAIARLAAALSLLRSMSSMAVDTTCQDRP